MVARQQLGTAMQRRTNSKTPSAGATSARTASAISRLRYVRRLDHGVEEVGLVREAAVEGAHPDVGPQGDLLHGGFVPVLGEDVAGGEQNAAQVDLGVPPERPRLHRPGSGPGGGAACHARSSGPKAMAPTMTSASAVSAGCGSRSTMEGASRFGMASAASAATTRASPLTAKANM